MSADDLDGISTLIAKLEALDGPNFEIENLICETLGLAPQGFERNAQGGWTHYVTERDDVQIWRCPAYTASIDAALRLVPSGFESISMAINERGPSSARVGHPYTFGNGATPAIALCIAAVRARTAIAKAEGAS